MRVLENQCRSLKTESVFSLVCPIFSFIPFNVHYCTCFLVHAQWFWMLRLERFILLRGQIGARPHYLLAFMALTDNHLTNRTVMLTQEMISACQPVPPAALSHRTNCARTSCVQASFSFSIACAHFTKTWGMAAVDTRSTEQLPVSLSPLFSHSCKLPLLQPLCFDNDLDCPGVGGTKHGLGADGPLLRPSVSQISIATNFQTKRLLG